jgi:hypothetical protein
MARDRVEVGRASREEGSTLFGSAFFLLLLLI